MLTSRDAIFADTAVLISYIHPSTKVNAGVRRMSVYRATQTVENRDRSGWMREETEHMERGVCLGGTRVFIFTFLVCYF